jgi:hypothetical protein
MKRVNLISALVLWLFAANLPAAEPLPELRDLNLKNWNCLNNPAGTAKKLADMARNRVKNRDWIDVAHVEAPQWDSRQFVASVRAFDTQLGGHHRADLTPAEAAMLAAFEGKIVSLTGYVVLTYPGPKESCNCGSEEFHDWHVEVLSQPLDHVPKIGDPTPIICEVTPRTEAHLYASGVRLQKLAEFIRLGEPPHLQSFPTGSKPHKVRMTGYLMWDDYHDAPGKDIGPTIETGGGSDYCHPWRAMAWEIHPILKIEDLDAAE